MTVKDRPESHDLLVMEVNRKDDGFAALMGNHRAQDTIRQRVLCCSLPDGRMVVGERLDAFAGLYGRAARSGFHQNRKRRLPPSSAACATERRILYHPNGAETFPGFPGNDPDADVVFDLRDPGWLNVDDQLGIVFKGTGGTRYVKPPLFSAVRVQGGGRRSVPESGRDGEGVPRRRAGGARWRC